MRTIFSVEGNIGSGKTTLLSLICKEIPQIKIMPEPVADWQNISKFNLLDQYYKEPHRWAYTFQINAVVSRMKNLRNLIKMMNNSPQHKFFTERSIIADKQIFAKMLHLQNKMNDLEFELYTRMFESLDNLFENPKEHKFVYLRTNPTMCMERMKKRSRFEESNIPLDYIKQIHQLHESWFQEQKNSLIIDGDIEFQGCSTRTGEIIKRIKEFID